MVKRFAPDTNFFLQARSPAELPWEEVTDADSIELVVLFAVVGELDNHKGKGNSRAARRARAALTKLDPLIDDHEQKVVEREAAPRVVWRLAPQLDPKREKPDALDLSTPDGRIVEQALAVSRLLSDELIFLTHDRVPRITARQVGLGVQKIPDSWLVPPETDERDKENARLKAEIKTWTSREPSISLALLAEGGEVGAIEGTLTHYAPLSEAFANEAFEAIVRRHPELDPASEGSITIVREADREFYRSKRAEWVSEVWAGLRRFPHFMSLQHGVHDVLLRLTNDGSVPAEGLAVDVSVEGPLTLTNPRGYQEHLAGYRFQLPSPPKYPTTYTMLGHLDHTRIALRPLDVPRAPLVPLHRDPRKFYWDYGEFETFGSLLRGSCDEFRHQVDLEEVPLMITLPWGLNQEPKGRLVVRYSAKNLTTPVERVFPIRCQLMLCDPEPLLRDALKDYL